MWGKAKDRKNCSVLPDDEDSYRNAAKYAPHTKRPSASAGIRWSSPHTWIWLLLVANLFVVLIFIFLSAYYFPVADTAEVLLHHPPLHQEPLITKHSTTSLRPASESPHFGQKTLQGKNMESDQHQEELPSAPMEQDSEFASAVKAAEAEFIVVATDDPKEAERQETSALVVEADAVYEEGTAATTEQVVHMDEDITAGQHEAEPVPQQIAEVQGEPEPEATTGPKLPSHIAGMLARMKATQKESMGEQKGSEPALDGTSLPRVYGDVDTERGRSFPLQLGDDGQETAQPALHQSLFVWLKADEGIELVDREACLQSQNPDACELTSWTNQIRSTNALVPTAFKPASSLRPVWLPKPNVGGSELPAVAFSCPLKAKHASFPESMTLFFVLSPTDIEQGDSYAGQKFFGSSPYGQFALHGGKPSFFGSTGLIESNETLQPSHSSILVYRLQSHSVEIKVQGRAWTPLPSEARLIRLSQNAEISLGNAKPVCDTNAFRGRISEVMLYSVALDDERVEAVEKYLQSRYGTDADGVVPASVSEHTEQEPKGQEDEEAPVDAERGLDAAAGTSDNTLTAGNEPSSVHTESPQRKQQAQQVAVRGQDQPAILDDYNPELVFEWAPSQDLLDAKGLSPTVAEQWTSAVREKVELIQNFQLGGQVLRDLIHEHKEELLRLHDDLFGVSSRE